MTKATVPARRKHIYFYVLLVLATVAFANILKPAESARHQNKGRRAIEAHKLAPALFAPAHATTHRLPLSQRTSTMQGSVSQPASSGLDHVWKFSLLGLAALGFLIRKRL